MDNLELPGVSSLWTFWRLHFFISGDKDCQLLSGVHCRVTLQRWVVWQEIFLTVPPAGRKILISRSVINPFCALDRCPC